MRRKMGMQDSAGQSEQPAGDEPEGDDSARAFLKPDMLGGKQWKAGEEIVLKIVSIDPETGEAEVMYAPGGDQETEPNDSMEAMDKTFPEEGGGDY